MYTAVKVGLSNLNIYIYVQAVTFGVTKLVNCFEMYTCHVPKPVPNLCTSLDTPCALLVHTLCTGATTWTFLVHNKGTDPWIFAAWRLHLLP